MNIAECDVCKKEIPTGSHYYSIVRGMFRRSTASGYDHKFERRQPPNSVLTVCEGCIVLLRTGRAPFRLLTIEEERIPECVDTLKRELIYSLIHDDDVILIPDVHSCSICDRDIEIGSQYMLIRLSSRLGLEDGSVRSLDITSLATLCYRCSRTAFRVLE